MTLDPDKSLSNHSNNEMPTSIGIQELHKVLENIRNRQQQDLPSIYSMATQEVDTDPTSQILFELRSQGKISFDVYALHSLSSIENILKDAHSFGKLNSLSDQDLEKAYPLYRKMLRGIWEGYFRIESEGESTFESQPISPENFPHSEIERKILFGNLAVDITQSFKKIQHNQSIYAYAFDEHAARALYHGPQVTHSQNSKDGQTSVFNSLYANVQGAWLPIYSKKWNGETRASPFWEREVEFIRRWQEIHPEHFARTGAGHVISPQRDEIRMIDLLYSHKNGWEDGQDLLEKLNPNSPYGFVNTLNFARAYIDWLATVSQFASVDDLLIDGKGTAVYPNYLNDKDSTRYALRTYDYGACTILTDEASRIQSIEKQRNIMCEPAMGILTKSGLIDVEAVKNPSADVPTIRVNDKQYRLQLTYRSAQRAYSKEYGSIIEADLAKAINSDDPASNTIQILDRLADLKLPSLPHYPYSTIEQMMLYKSALSRLSFEQDIVAYINHNLSDSKDYSDNECVNLIDNIFNLKTHPESKWAIKRIEVILAIEGESSIKEVRTSFLGTNEGKISLARKLINLLHKMK